MSCNTEDIVKLLLALFLGAVIGAEREYRSKSAGFRTMTLITMGSTLFTIFSIKINGDKNIPPVIIASVVNGIGFLGAGVIFKEEKGVSGITTAALIWLCAALGIGVGAGYFAIAIIAFLITMIILIVFIALEKKIDKANQIRHYRIVDKFDENTIHKFEKLFKHFKLFATKGKQSKTNGNYVGDWVIQGRQNNHDQLINALLDDESIIEFDF